MARYFEYGWAPYVTVAQRRAQAYRALMALRKEEAQVRPVHIQGRKITRKFWGPAWCDHLEVLSDYVE